MFIFKDLLLLNKTLVHCEKLSKAILAGRKEEEKMITPPPLKLFVVDSLVISLWANQPCPCYGM